MPLYIVKHGDTERLIEASHPSVAIRHAAKDVITAAIAKPLEIARLASDGVSVEHAGSAE